MIAPTQEPRAGSPFRKALACTRCGKLVVESTDEPVLCLTCKVVTAPPPEIAARDLQVKRRLWPWLVGAAVIAAAGVGVKAYLASEHRREEFEALYPIVATPKQEEYLREHAKAWSAGKAKLVAAVAALPAGKVAGTGTCPLRVETPAEANVAEADIADYPFREKPNPDKLVRPFLVAGPDLDRRVASHVDELVAAADRIRFQTGESEYRVFAAIGIPLVIVRLGDDTAPELVRGGTGDDSFNPGHRAGTAYVFDRASGALRCSGEFVADSSDSVGATTRGFDNAAGMLARDLDEQTLRAIQASLVAVE